MRHAVLVLWMCSAAVMELSLPQPLAAQEKDFGFRNIAAAYATGEELTSQTNLWVLEVQF